MRKPWNALLVAAALSPFPAFAQEDELVVTATRAATPLDQLPARVEIINRADIEAQGFATLAQALGAQAVQAGGPGQQTSLFLRGANSKHALVLFDGIRLNDASTPNAQYDFGLDALGALERVEVLRGPASAIYGTDAIGGVVNLIPRRGGEEAIVAEAMVGSFDTMRGAITASGGVGGFDYGFSAEAFETGGFDLIPDRMATAIGDRDGARLAALTGSVRSVRDRWGADALFQVRQSEAAFDTFAGGAFFDLRADDPDLENQALQSIWRLGADYAANGAITARFSGGEVRSDRAERDGGVEVSSAQSARAFVDATAHYAGQRSTLTAGFSLERNSIDTDPQFAASLRIAEEQSAIYLIGQTQLVSGLSVTGAVRVDDYERFGAQATYSAGAVAHLGGLRIYASGGTAFKAPSLSERFEISPPFNLGNRDLKPERARAWEAGADWAPSAAFTLGLSYYQTRVEDLIDYNFLQSKNVNVGEAELEGVETVLDWAPVNWVSTRLAYIWTDARNRVTHARLLRRPEHAWQAELEFKPGENWALGVSFNGMGARNDVTYANAGAFQSAAGRTPGFGLISLWAHYDLGDAELFARMENVSDERYEQPAAFAGAPRNLQAGLRLRF